MDEKDKFVVMEDRQKEKEQREGTSVDALNKLKEILEKMEERSEELGERPTKLILMACYEPSDDELSDYEKYMMYPMNMSVKDIIYVLRRFELFYMLNSV